MNSRFVQIMTCVAVLVSVMVVTILATLAIINVPPYSFDLPFPNNDKYYVLGEPMSNGLSRSEKELGLTDNDLIFYAFTKEKEDCKVVKIYVSAKSHDVKLEILRDQRVTIDLKSFPNAVEVTANQQYYVLSNYRMLERSSVGNWNPEERSCSHIMTTLRFID